MKQRDLMRMARLSLEDPHLFDIEIKKMIFDRRHTDVIKIQKKIEDLNEEVKHFYQEISL